MDEKLLQSIFDEHGDSRRAVAEKLGMTGASLSHKMSHKTPWKLSEVQKLIEVYGLRMSDVEKIFFQ